MDPLALTNLLKEGGPYALLALSLLVNAGLFVKLLGCYDARIVEGAKVATLAEKSSASMAAMAAAADSRAMQTERHSEKVDQLTHAVELASQRASSKVDQTIQALEDMRRRQ